MYIANTFAERYLRYNNNDDLLSVYARHCTQETQMNQFIWIILFSLMDYLFVSLSSSCLRMLTFFVFVF